MMRSAAADRMLAILPVFCAFALAALVIGVLGRPDYSVALMLGVIAGGLVDMDHRASGRLQNLLIMLFSFFTASVAVQMALGTAWAMVVVMTGIAFVATFCGALDSRYRTLAFGMLTVALYTTLSGQEGVPWPVHTVLIVSGALIYQICTFVFYLFFPHRPVQTSLAAAYSALADYIAAKAAFFDPDEREHLDEAEARLADKTQDVTAAFNQCRDALFVRLGRQTLQSRTQRQLHAYFIAQDIHERISSSHTDYGQLIDTLQHSDVIFRIARLIRLQSRACGRMARDLLREVPYRHDPILNRALAGLQRAWQAFPQESARHQDIDRLIANLARINAQLVRLGDQDGAAGLQLGDARLAAPHIASLAEARQVLARNLTLQSPCFRHALRMAIITCLSTLFIESLQLSFGYWILLTAVFVIQPNYAATQNKVLQRIIGTVSGAFAGVLVPWLAPSFITLISLQVIANTLFFYFRARNYSFSTFFITAQVFIGFAIAGHTHEHLFFARIGDSLIGVAIAWLGIHLLWPDWRYISLSGMGKAALASNAAYLRAILAQTESAHADDIDYRASRRRVHENAAALAKYAADSARGPARYNNPAAQQLVQHNYRILASLSALGAGRFVDERIPLGAYRARLEAIAGLMEESAGLDAEHLAVRIAALRSTDGTPLERQLQRILDQLPAMHDALLAARTSATGPRHKSAR